MGERQLGTVKADKQTSEFGRRSSPHQAQVIKLSRTGFPRSGADLRFLLAPVLSPDFSPRTGKGGASAPPLRDAPRCYWVSRPARCIWSSGAGRETRQNQEAASSAGLKPCPSGRPARITGPGEKSRLAPRIVGIFTRPCRPSGILVGAVLPPLRRQVDVSSP
jgi:hypothetical protein